MTEHRERYVVTPRAAAAQYRGCQQALRWALRELTEARAEIETLRADEQHHAADWLAEFAGMTDDQVARRHLLVAAECIRTMGDWEGYEMHPVTMSELEREIRQSERERCAALVDEQVGYAEIVKDFGGPVEPLRRLAAAIRAGGAE